MLTCEGKLVEYNQDDVIQEIRGVPNKREGSKNLLASLRSCKLIANFEVYATS